MKVCPVCYEKVADLEADLAKTQAALLAATQEISRLRERLKAMEEGPA